MTSVTELDAQIAELKRQRDIASLDNAKALQTVLATGTAATLADDLAAILADMSSEGLAVENARNLVECFRNAKGNIDTDVARIQALVDAQAAAE